MKIFNSKLFILGLIGFGLLFVASCTKDFDEINTNPNSPEEAPTNMIFNGATAYVMNYTRDGWWSARMTLPWMQYSGQRIYQEEDKYQYRETQTDNGWFYLYKTATDLKTIIDMCSDEEIAVQMAAYGNPQNQIAASRIMLAYVFDELATHFGDVPYWSHGSRGNADFQALQINDYLTPKYAAQEAIYADILKELGEAADQLVLGDPVFTAGDNIYGGNAGQWKKFANSLKLRIANRIKDVSSDAQSYVNQVKGGGVDLILTNADNAVQKFGASSTEGSPFWKTFMVGNRQDFVSGAAFVDLLKGKTGGFGVDPRLPKMVAPVGIDGFAVEGGGYSETSYEDLLADASLLDQYVGMPSGLPIGLVADNSGLIQTSYFSVNIMKPDFGEVLMEAAEVHFILSELNGWDNDSYRAGVEASLAKWGVSAGDIADFVGGLGAADKASVLTQKYVALLMQPKEAWCEYRRTGYPDGSVLVLPGAESVDVNGESYTMTPMRSGNVLATNLPDRVRYPTSEQNINVEAWKSASGKLSNGDEINSKLWWAQ